MDVPPSSCLETSGEYSILRLNTIALSGKRYLVIIHEVAQWKDTRELNRGTRTSLAPSRSDFLNIRMFLEDSWRKRRYAVETTVGARSKKRRPSPHWAIASKVDSFVGGPQNATRRPKGRAAAAINIFPGASRSGF